MPLTIRTADPAADYPAVAALYNAVSTDRITVDDLRANDARTGPDEVRRRFVADRDGRVVAYGYVLRADYDLPGHFWTWLTVADDVRREGIGARLYGEALAFARTCGATALHSEVSESFPEAQRFAQVRGFTLEGHLFESVLALGAFDMRAHAGLLGRAEAGGIRVFSLAEGGNMPGLRRQLYEVNYRGVLDDPGHGRASWLSFEEFSAITDAPWFQPEGQILAADGDAVVGLSAVTYDASTNTANQLMTAVERAYRGRGIAQALKLRAIEYALACGATSIRTRNDLANAPMLAVNYKLGFRPEPGLLPPGVSARRDAARRVGEVPPVGFSH